MKKPNVISSLFLTLLLACNALGADFAGSFSEYRSQIRLLLGLTTTNTTYGSDSTFNQCIRQSVIAVNPIIKGKKQTYKVAISSSVDSYTLDTGIIAVDNVEIFRTKTLKQLKYVSRETFWQMPKDDNAGKTGKPALPDYYDWTDGSIYIWPPPEVSSVGTTSGDSLRITATKQIPSIAAVDSLVIIPQEYRTAIVQYATWLVARSRNHPMTEIFRRDAIEAIQMVNVALNQRKAPSDSAK